MIAAQIEIETLLVWAFREELPKRQLSAQEMCWESIAISGPFGPIDEGISIQRYAYVGEPHPDARIIEKAVEALPLVVIDWAESLDAIMGDLAGLVSINDLRRQDRADRATTSGWTLGKGRHETARNAPASHDLRGRSARDVLLPGSIQVGELIVTHARQGTRPRWYPHSPTCHPTPSRDPSKALLVGQSGGRNLYSIGSHCPLTWRPSPISIAKARADYIGWWRGLSMLVDTLSLNDHKALPPISAQLPWFECEPEAVRFQCPSPKMATLPLRPQRAAAGRTRGQNEDIWKCKG